MHISVNSTNQASKAAADMMPSGFFQLGCNYWASHAGTAMWSNFDAPTVDRDFAQLREIGITWVRLFPLWPDFQPIQLLTANEGEPIEHRWGEEPLPYTDAGEAGVSETMMHHFKTVSDLAEKHGLKLIVGLITGWMSGRLFTPPAFVNLNVITDPTALMWQARFVRYFVRTLASHPAIAAWDLGNECNVMGKATRSQAWVWTHAVATTIRSVDPSRPVISGMHSLPAEARKPWSIRDQAELTDILTTHPYPVWTPHCNYDPVTTMRPQLHATAETLLYRGIAGKPCFIEEMGTIGPITVSDDLTSSYLRASFLSAWAHDCRAAMWWCAYDQKHLTQAPYDWCLAEEELGFFRKDRSAKPVAQAVKTFSEMLENLPVEFKPLPPRITEGICVLSDDQDQWAVAYGAFLLAKQAGVDIEFQMYDQPLRDAQVYLLPCINGAKPLSRRAWLGLMEKVSEGATLYFSLDQGIVHGLEEATGVEVKTRERVSFECLCRLNNEQEIRIPTDFRYVLEAKRAKVLGADAQGNPIFTEAEYGRGKVFLLTVPLESKWTLQPRALLSESFAAAWKIYSTVFSSKASARAVHVFGEDIGATEHVISSTQRVAIIINHTTTRSSHRFEITKGWSLGTIYRGQVRNNSVDIEPCDAALLILQIESS